MTYIPSASGEDPDDIDYLENELEQIADWASLDEWESREGAPEGFDLEHSELDRRLRNLVWPAPPAEVRERCLQAVLRSGTLACPPPPPVHPLPPGSARKPRFIENVERYELSRRRTEAIGLRRLTAPRLPARFATSL